MPTTVEEVLKLDTPEARWEALRQAIADEIGVEADDVTPEKRLVEDFEADSLDVVELCITVEETFGIAIDDDYDLSKLKTVKDWQDHIEKALK